MRHIFTAHFCKPSPPSAVRTILSLTFNDTVCFDKLRRAIHDDELESSATFTLNGLQMRKHSGRYTRLTFALLIQSFVNSINAWSDSKTSLRWFPRHALHAVNDLFNRANVFFRPEVFDVTVFHVESFSSSNREWHNAVTACGAHQHISPKGTILGSCHLPSFHRPEHVIGNVFTEFQVAESVVKGAIYWCVQQGWRQSCVHTLKFSRR